MKLKIRIVTTLALCCLSGSAFAININTGEFPDKTPDEVNAIVIKALDKLDSGRVAREQTNGFTYRYTNPFINIYPFDIYIGEYKNGSMVRIESLDNTNNALLSVFTTEAYGTKFPITHQPKSLIIGDLLTVVLPAAGHIYTTIDSPTNTSLSWLYSILYLGIDGGLLWMGGTSFFTHSFDPFQTGLISTLSLMGTYRAAHLILNHLSIMGHNRMIQLGYTFQFE